MSLYSVPKAGASARVSGSKSSAYVKVNPSAVRSTPQLFLRGDRFLAGNVDLG